MRTYEKRDIGTAAHGGFAAIHDGLTDEEVSHLTHQAAEAAYIEARNARTDEQAISYADFWLGKDKKPTAMKRAESAVRYYQDWLEEGHDVGAEVLAVEHVYDIGGTYGTIDCVMEHPLYGLTILDMKTADAFEPMQQVDFQLRSYALAWWRLTGNVPQTGMQRQVKRTLYGGTAKGPHVEQFTLHLDKDILAKHNKHMQAQRQEIELGRANVATASYLYPSPAKTCGYMCDYQAECGAMDLG